MILLSIIIPAYNAEKYIGQCLCSCFRMQQGNRLSEEEMEVIVVDDGSTDATPALLDDASKQHANLRIFWQENQGQSVARNLAIGQARGQYIYMVDADDALTEDAQLPIKDMRDGLLDIIGVQVYYQRENGRRTPWSHQMERWPFDQEYATGAAFVNHHNIEGLVYGYLFRRQLFIDHPELRFTPGIYHQDEELIFKAFTLAGPVVYRRGYTYIYYEHTGSSIHTHTETRKRKLLEDDLTILQRLIAWRDERGLHDVMEYKLGYLAMDTLRLLLTRGYDTTYAMDVLRRLREIRLHPLPWLWSWKYLCMKGLTQSTWTVRLLLWLNDRAHRNCVQ